MVYCNEYHMQILVRIIAMYEIINVFQLKIAADYDC